MAYYSDEDEDDYDYGSDTDYTYESPRQTYPDAPQWKPELDMLFKLSSDQEWLLEYVKRQFTVTFLAPW
jgi:hypothetical protein